MKGSRVILFVFIVVYSSLCITLCMGSPREGRPTLFSSGGWKDNDKGLLESTEYEDHLPHYPSQEQRGVGEEEEEEEPIIYFPPSFHINPEHDDDDTFYHHENENPSKLNHNVKPEAVVEIMMDDEAPGGGSSSYGPGIVEHSSITTSIQNTESEYRASCVKEPGCRWECEPRQDELPPDCDCVCHYTDAKWDTMP